MRRIMLRIAYDGTDYVGWQKQPNGLAVEEVLNKALRDLTGEQIEVIGASRTDSGVHALDNVAVFDTESPIPAKKFSFALNRRLPNSVVVRSSCEVKPNFHPRRVNCVKTYESRIFNDEHPNPLNRRYTYFYHHDIDVDAMREAAHYLEGEHNFVTFCSAGAQVTTTVRTIYSAEVIRGAGYDENCIIIRLKGNGFLYNMVRIIAGTLLQAGTHAIEPARMAEIIESRDRGQAGPTLPPQGLTLVHIEYPEGNR